MGLVDLAPVTLIAAKSVALDLTANGIGDCPCEIKLLNESPLTCLVTIGADQHRLGAWTVDRYPLNGKLSVRVDPSQVQTPAPAPVPSNLLFITVAPAGETIPGTYPAPLGRMSTGTENVQSPQSNLGTVTLTGNTSQSKSYSVPTGTHSIGVLVQSGSLTTLKVSGGGSGGPYLSLPPVGVTGATLQGPFICAFFSAIDSSVNVYLAAGAAGAVVQIVAILSAQAQFVFDNISESTAVGIVGGSGTVLGDTTAPSLNADSVTETVSGVFAANLVGVVMAIASFKAAAGQTIALVKAGALLAFDGINPNSPFAWAAIPTFGQATAAGNLLVAAVSCTQNSSVLADAVTTTAAGWVRAVLSGNGGAAGAQEVAIFYKPNCGAGEAAPTFTGNLGSFGLPHYLQLLEFSGAALASVLDQTGTINIGGGPAATQTVTTGAPDVASGDLVITASRWASNNAGGLTSNYTTFTDTGNNATPISAASSAVGTTGGNGGIALGPATGVGAGSLTDSGQAFNTNQWGGWVVVMGGDTANVNTNTATVLTLGANWSPATPATGNYVLSQPLRHSSFTYGVVPAFAVAAPLGVEPWPYDSTGSSGPGVGTAASVTLAANATKKYTLAMVSADSIQGGATAEVGDILSWTGFQARVAVVAGAGNYWHKELPGIAYSFALNTAVTVSFGGNSPTCSQSLAIGAYLR
jgi:hypothetical protein